MDKKELILGRYFFYLLINIIGGGGGKTYRRLGVQPQKSTA